MLSSIAVLTSVKKIPASLVNAFLTLDNFKVASACS
jgi:hypothetical protein